jgi:predicted Zn-dependent protease
MRRLALWLAILIMAVSAAGCATKGVNKGQFNVVSLDEEWQLGRKLDGDLQQKLAVIHDREADAFLNSIGRQIVSQTEMASLPWQFHLVRDPQVNAFNIPGGHVYVFSGLVTQSNELSELVGVLSHEISHGVARHGTEMLSKQYGFAVVASLVLGKNPAVYQQILADIVGQGTMMKFSRDAEREADRLGVHYMYESGYDPAGMEAMFQNLLALRQSRPGAIEQFFASHPLTEERIQNTRSEISKLSPRGDLVMDTSAYHQFRDRIASLAGGQP